ncbi:hypothetical protein PYCCODRAFT_336992 [Trametes coccinea BRFM310]|uniref:Uncharacterized protein n=1 Tax=Trametes coccinea (strain BRFM310) TaxID=1353009 RepID=A0A1Y2J436_TRAC3|nr:hypothetical protein PYCCODRAFT_336992 [Trametes coccinea BRFM310]
MEREYQESRLFCRRPKKMDGSLETGEQRCHEDQSYMDVLRFLGRPSPPRIPPPVPARVSPQWASAVPRAFTPELHVPSPIQRSPLPITVACRAAPRLRVRTPSFFTLELRARIQMGSQMEVRASDTRQVDHAPTQSIQCPGPSHQQQQEQQQQQEKLEEQQPLSESHLAEGPNQLTRRARLSESLSSRPEPRSACMLPPAHINALNHLQASLAQLERPLPLSLSLPRSSPRLFLS